MTENICNNIVRLYNTGNNAKIMTQATGSAVVKGYKVMEKLSS